MILLIWRGKGWLVPVAAFAGFILSGILNDIFGPLSHFASNTLFFICITLGVLPLWWYGKKRRAETRELIDPQTNEKVILVHSDEFFWIPMSYWAILIPGFIILVNIINFFVA